MDVANDSLIPFLKKKRIYNIDLVITTHNDYDHCGALDSLKENFYVKNGKLVFVFAPYAIGPFCDGEIEVAVPLKTLRAKGLLTAYGGIF